MITDQDREFARRQARLIYENHLKHGRAGCDANHIAANLDYEEALRRGLLAECAFANEFGVSVRTDLDHWGDGGRDFALRLFTNYGPQVYPINVKAKTVRVSWDGLLRSGTHLRVPVKETRCNVIYVFAIYLESSDNAEVLRWDWGQALIDFNLRAKFENGNGEECYLKPFEFLRNLIELRGRQLAWEGV